ncbi:hypothetical protein [Streptomyces sp. NBC_01431]|uniref:hypothetical protein n=1 Tax=Streptomyces sp. NBC_01431 TaxID=2903863 RepID=UPI002E2ED334|nr:hypothetical protein [Streptomyces sp. NBC_01431]
MATPDQVPAWPLYELRADDDGTVTLTGPAATPGPYPGRTEALAAAAALAARHLRPPRAVRATAIDADGTEWPLIIATDGTAREAGPARRPKASRRKKNGQPAPVPAFPVAPVPAPAPAIETHPDLAPAPFPPAVDDEPSRTVRIASPRRSRVPADPRQPAAPTEQHSRAQETAPPQGPAEPAADEPRAKPATYLRIRTLAEAGQLTEARSVAAELDGQASRVHGPSHPTALEAREVLAHITAQSGDLPTAVRLYRDVAERWWHQNLRQAADQAAGRAHALWLRIADPHQALAAGQDVIRMRQQIPGPDGRAYRQALHHMEQLETNHQPAPRI